MAATGGGHGDPSSSSSLERSRRRPSPSLLPRCPRRAQSGDRDSRSPGGLADLPESMCIRRARTFEPLAPSAHINVPDPVTHPPPWSEACARPGRDSNGKYLPRSTFKECTSNGNCYSCGRPLCQGVPRPVCAKVCAKVYAARIDDSDREPLPVVPEGPDREPQSSEDDSRPPQAEPDDVSDRDDGNAGVISDQYTTSGDDERYPFPSKEGSQIISRATRVVPWVQEDPSGVRAAKASKPGVPAPKAVESNRACYKIGAGKQPSGEPRLQRCIEILVPVNGLKLEYCWMGAPIPIWYPRNSPQ